MNIQQPTTLEVADTETVMDYKKDPVPILWQLIIPLGRGMMNTI